MFSVKHNECVGFESRWVVKKVSQVNSTQTTEFSTKDTGTNTKNGEDIEVQTIPEPKKDKEEVDMERLAEWLNKLYPNIVKEINKTQNSKAFKNYQLIGDCKEVNCKIMQTINLNPVKNKKKLMVSSLSWNCTGKLLAASTASLHDNWCHHKGVVQLFTLNKNEELSFKLKFSIDSCVMILKFHPNLPFILAASTYSGEILIWDLKLDEELIIKVNAHEECVSCLSWINDLDNPKNVLLGSSSLDGLLKLWNLNLNNSVLTIKQKYKIKSPFCPKDYSPVPIVKDTKGIICFDFSKFVPDKFIVGVEGGMIAQCSMLGTTKLKGSTTEEPLSDPLFKYYTSHKGEIISIKFSPNHKDMFLTNASDGEIRFYLLDQDDPAKIIFVKNQINSINWIPHEEKIIAGCGNKGIIEIFHLINGKLIEDTIKEKIPPQNLMQMEICHRSTDMVAVGSETGDLQLWNVPWGSFSDF